MFGIAQLPTTQPTRYKYFANLMYFELHANQLSASGRLAFQ